MRAHGGDTRTRVAEHMGEHGHLLEGALASEWYPEEARQGLLAGLRTELAGSDDARFMEILRALVGAGVARFFRALLQHGSADFVLRKVPVLWERMQRGHGEVTVATGAERSTIRLEGFPFFADPHYPLMTAASVQAMVEAAVGTVPDVRTGGRGADWLELEVLHTL